MPQRHFTSRPASSLIFVMLVVAGIVTVILGAQRLALVQFGQSVSSEDDLSAYYAAKAGIEDGLTRFRFNRNADTIQSDGETAERYDLTTGQNIGYVQDNTAITNTSAYNADNQYYDLKISYRVAQLQNISISQDDTFELTGFPDSASPYYLYYQLTFPAGQTGCSVTLQQVLQTSTGVQTYQQTLAQQIGSQTVYDSGNQGTNLYIRSSAGGASLANYVRIQPLGANQSSNCSVTANFQTATGSSGTAPAGVDFDSTQTIITATGYFGTTKRTLIGTIDRQSGQLLGVEGFNAYAGEGNISP